MKFPSQKDFLLTLLMFLPILISMISGSILFVMHQWGGFILLLVVVVICLYMWVGTYYVIQEDELLVRGGLFRWRIPIRSIQSIRKTRNPASSPALSLNRLEILHEAGMICISPVNQEQFIQMLAKKNPYIRILF